MVMGHESWRVFTRGCVLDRGRGRRGRTGPTIERRKLEGWRGTFVVGGVEPFDSKQNYPTHSPTRKEHPPLSPKANPVDQLTLPALANSLLARGIGKSTASMNGGTFGRLKSICRYVK